ncbi:MAG: YbaK/EbsC family protein [Actinomycetales bacterium]|nr:MAG: YbaK/EbsC family protein [Actinomycetales bacterium]
MSEPVGRRRVEADALARGLEVELVERPRASSLEESARLMGIEPADIVKTLVVKKADGTFLLALVPGDRQVAWKKLRAVVGVNKLQLPDADQALEATGYERGTITPLGAHGSWPVVIDSSVLGRRIALGAGEHGWGAWVDADALARAYGATVADIS